MSDNKNTKCHTCNGLGYLTEPFDVHKWLADEKQAEALERIAYYDRPDIKAKVDENHRRNRLSCDHIEHICGMFCDGQDGTTSDCCRIRVKLFGKWHFSDEEIAAYKDKYVC